MISPAERAARQVYANLSSRESYVVREWLATGHNMRDAILASNALGTGELRTPADALREERYARDKRQASEHEAAHLCVASAVGLDAKYATISPDGSGECGFAKGGTPLQRATVLLAGEIWINKFRRDAFPNGAKGLKGDHKALSIYDVFVMRRAMDLCIDVLRDRRAIILAAADRIEKVRVLRAMKWNLGLFGFRRDTPESEKSESTLVRGDDQTEKGNVMEENVMETLNALVTIAPTCAFCTKPVTTDQEPSKFDS